MCTAISLPGGFFGRTLDLHQSPGERVCRLDRGHSLSLRCGGTAVSCAAMIGMAHESEGTPLFYDAMNEHGLAMAALRFPDHCAYHGAQAGKLNLAPFEVIPYVLGACRTLEDARKLLACANIADASFSPALPNTPLHFMLADKRESLVIESTADGLHLCANPAGVMTNSPDFPWHLQHLALRAHRPGGESEAALPGDFSSASRFVRAAYARKHSTAPEGVSGTMQLFHLLYFVSVPRGLTQGEGNTLPYTVYACAMDLKRRIYCYKTYEEGIIRQEPLFAQFSKSSDKKA